MDQAMTVIDDELGQLHTIAGDWAPWNDTYLFVQNKYHLYPRRWITCRHFKNIQVTIPIFNVTLCRMTISL
ncbi:CHASE4 domain-containing protein [uncultured Desulfobacter sp.]|uniref:CHASE4 domain-containing protein n=1 Tax=uncultured Desulfobacter sp. TaxID=240139 RepID=UPI003747960C